MAINFNRTGFLSYQYSPNQANFIQEQTAILTIYYGKEPNYYEVNHMRFPSMELAREFAEHEGISIKESKIPVKPDDSSSMLKNYASNFDKVSKF